MNFAPGTYIHLRRTQPGKETVLSPGRVVWSHDALIAAEVDREAVSSDEACELAVLYEGPAHRFVCQRTEVEGIIQQEAADAPTAEDIKALDLATDTDDRVVVVFELTGEPESAEQRECYRVRATSFGIEVFTDTVTFELADISQTGFAMIGNVPFERGAVIDVRLRVDDQRLEGPVRIQSVRQLRNGFYRCGATCLNRETLQQCARLATELQRRLLRKLSGQPV